MTPNDPRNGPPNAWPPNAYGPAPNAPNAYGPPQYAPQNPYGGYGAPPPYAPYPYAMTTAPPEDSEATTIFILGILGLVMCQIVAPIAWAKGNTYRATCRAMERPPSGMATAGWVMGIVGTVMLVLSILLVVVSLALG